MPGYFFTCKHADLLISDNTGGCSPLSYSMHTRAERKMLPKGSPHAALRLALRALNLS